MNFEVKLCGVKLKNPLVLASGILGSEAEIMARVAKQGIGAVTSKSCSLKPNIGNENPTVLAWDHGLINAVGLTNPGVKQEIIELKKLKKLTQVKIIASIFGPTIKDIVETAKIISQADPDFIEVNISCPHADASIKGCFYSNPFAVKKLALEIKKKLSLPLIIKLSPNVEDITVIAKAAEAGGADAISAINTLGPGMIIDLEAQKPVLSNKIGGLSGPAIKPIAIRCIYQIFKAVKIPIIGMGGVLTGKDAIEMIMAGASAVGIGSAVYYRGIKVFNKIIKEMEEYCSLKGIKKLEAIKGIAHE